MSLPAQTSFLLQLWRCARAPKPV